MAIYVWGGQVERSAFNGSKLEGFVFSGCYFCRILHEAVPQSPRGTLMGPRPSFNGDYHGSTGLSVWPPKNTGALAKKI